MHYARNITQVCPRTSPRHPQNIPKKYYNSLQAPITTLRRPYYRKPVIQASITTGPLAVLQTFADPITTAMHTGGYQL